MDVIDVYLGGAAFLCLLSMLLHANAQRRQRDNEILRALVLASLKDGEATATELSEELGIRRARIVSVLSRLCASKKLGARPDVFDPKRGLVYGPKLNRNF